MVKINLPDEYLGASVQVFRQCESLVNIEANLSNKELYEPVKHCYDQLHEAMNAESPNHEEIERLAVNACAQLLHFITNYNEMEG